MSNLKIPVVLGINDNPIPPNFNNNRRGCNGSYIVQKHNYLVDVLNLLDADNPEFQIANLPTYLELGEPLTTINTPLTFYFEQPGTYAKYYHGDSISELTQLIATPFQSNSVYDHYYSDINNQPNTYVVPHTRVFAREVYESNTDHPIKSLFAHKQVSWKPKVVIGSSTTNNITTLNQLTSIHYNNFDIPTEALVLPDNTYSYIFLPVSTSDTLCYEPLESLFIFDTDSSGFVDVTPYEVTLTKTSSLGLNIEIDYLVYKLAFNSEPYKLGLNFNRGSNFVIDSYQVTQVKNWNTIEW